jgi:hypothetical protein
MSINKKCWLRKKKNIKLKEEKDRKLKELLDKYGLDYLV